MWGTAHGNYAPKMERHMERAITRPTLRARAAQPALLLINAVDVGRVRWRERILFERLQQNAVRWPIGQTLTHW